MDPGIVYAITYDPSRLYLVQVHTGACPSSADIEHEVRAIDRLRRDAEGMGGAPIAMLVIIETENGPSAPQRKRIADASRSLGRGWLAIVAPSIVTRALLTGIRWLRGETPLVESTHASYESARRWLATEAGQPEQVTDDLVRRARAQGERRALTSPPRA